MIGLNAVSNTYGVRAVSVSPKPDDVFADQVMFVLLTSTCCIFAWNAWNARLSVATTVPAPPIPVVPAVVDTVIV